MIETEIEYVVRPVKMINELILSQHSKAVFKDFIPLLQSSDVVRRSSQTMNDIVTSIIPVTCK